MFTRFTLLVQIFDDDVLPGLRLIISNRIQDQNIVPVHSNKTCLPCTNIHFLGSSCTSPLNRHKSAFALLVLAQTLRCGEITDFGEVFICSPDALWIENINDWSEIYWKNKQIQFYRFGHKTIYPCNTGSGHWVSVTMARWHCCI